MMALYRYDSNTNSKQRCVKLFDRSMSEVPMGRWFHSDYFYRENITNRPVSQMRATLGGLSRTSGKLCRQFQHKLIENQRTRENPGLPWPIHESWLYSANKLTDTSCTKIELSHRPHLLEICRRYSVSMFWNHLYEYIRPPTMLCMRWDSQI